MALSTSARAALFAAACAIGAASAAPAFANLSGPLRLWMTLVDLDGDGAVSRAELVQSRARMFPVWDRNQNGVLDPGDIGQRAALRFGQANVERFLEIMDLSGDGVVDYDELIAGPTPAFDAADANQDGFLTGGELSEFAAAVQAR